MVLTHAQSAAKVEYMNRYVILFSKHGLVRYTSHLDLLRIFKRGFKRAVVPIEYSKGFNPHPRIGVAQPLSLGYMAKRELLEFHTTQPLDTKKTLTDLRATMPIGIDLISCSELNISPKSLAAVVDNAKYSIFTQLPYEEYKIIIKEAITSYLDQPVISAMKRQKKTKKMVEVDIKKQIRTIELKKIDSTIVLSTVLDCGSQSNLSPELVISSFISHLESEYNLSLNRNDIEVSRDYINFLNGIF